MDEQVRKIFFQKIDLVTVKQATKLYNTYVQIMKQLNHELIPFEPDQIEDIDLFVKQLHQLLITNKIKIKLTALKTQFTALFQQEQNTSKTNKTNATKILQTHQSTIQNFLTSKYIIGESTGVDKVFSRAAEVPDPKLIRTSHTLKLQAQSLQRFFDDNKGVIQPKNKKHELDERYLYLQTRLRACRYDYQVQKIQDKNLCKILLLNVQASILAHDEKEFFTVIDVCIDSCAQNQVGDVQKLNFIKYLQLTLSGQHTMAQTTVNDKIIIFIKQFINNEPIVTEKFDRYEKTLITRIQNELLQIDDIEEYSEK